jgi:hypothetical protein
MPNRTKKLALLFDGTWCGRETGTTTNISILATYMGIGNMTAATGPYEIYDKTRGFRARYFPGCGLGDTFLAYLFNGATGSDIGQECIDAYTYIVDHYDEDTELWFFGHSRGSFTVRCVAGMINNCGIIKPRPDMTTEQRHSLCKEAYKMYRSPWDDEKPNSEKMKRFREKAAWHVYGPPAIKFMGIIDTVGSLGIPKLDGGLGFTWPEFFDQNISSEVQKVYHACSMHDRLWMFQPCRARRDPEKKYPKELGLEIHEKWFPGCHYDVGRQRFKFLRDGVTAIEKMCFRIPNLLTKPVIPNSVCADLVLLFLLEGIRDQGGSGSVIPNLSSKITDLNKVLKKPHPEIGSGDVYGDIQDYAPGGPIAAAISTISSFATKLTDHLTPTLKLGSAIHEFIGINTLLNILLAVHDRRIPGEQAKCVMLLKPSSELGNESVSRKAGLLKRNVKGAYQSKTFETFQAYLRAVGEISEEEFLERTVPNGWE